MNNKKIAVIAGTPVDAQMGVDFLKTKGIDAYSYPVSENPTKQLLFQVLPLEEKKEFLLKMIKDIKCDNIDAIFVYCNSLSSSIDFKELSEISKIYIVTPLDVYKTMANNYNYLGVICANGQSSGGIEKTIVNENPKCTAVTLGMMTLVNNVEEKVEPMDIIKNNHLENIIDFFEGINTQAIILGCTHFPYFEDALKSITKLDIINPAEKMYDLLCKNIK
ncbi:aspartate/glutamate racemase family protein [Intestinibacter sp.]